MSNYVLHLCEGVFIIIIIISSKQAWLITLTLTFIIDITDTTKKLIQ